MLVAVNIGNSSILTGFHEQGWIHTFRIPSMEEGAIELFARKLFESISSPPVSASKSDITGVICSVVPEHTAPYGSLLTKATGKPPLVVTNRIVTGLDPSFVIPDELGNDILANSVAAHAKIAMDSIVLDFGTALTITYVEKRGAIRGIAIVPGLATAARSLSVNTALLPETELRSPVSVFGTTTETCIQSGLIYGYTGLVEKIVSEMARETGAAPFIIATGGQCGIIASRTDVFNLIDPLHTMEGLRVLSALNR